ncbi:MAG TPA: hypothetical protein DEA08_23680, partial [Planctomycetes bacterium]|nr:hypothetical protein [Planctomycetota bacterium]
MAGCCAPGPPPGLRPDSPLPREVQLETPLEARGRSHEVAVRSGRLWIRALQPESEWTLAPSDGLPRAGCFGFEPPRALVAVSADGDNLVVVGETGRVFYAKLSSYDAGRGFDWVDEFGLLWKDEVVLPERQRAFAISHRGADAGYYEDIDGNRFPMSFGVSTLYALDASGQRIRYADPWLEPDWSHLFFTPLRGRFLAVNLAASASTLFVIDASGELWTRLADYDTSGENPLPGWYTYERGLRPGRNVRTLPGWDWVRQPRPPAEVTREITILQTGQGNDARELRVRGRDERGRAGFWTKPIAAPTWSFVAVPGWQVRDDELLRPLPGAERL